MANTVSALPANNADGESAGASPQRAHVLRLEILETALAALAILGGVLAMARLLGRGVFFDEFFTLAMTEPNLSVGEVFNYLKFDIHPPLHFLLIWFERLLGFESVGLLRASNLLGAAGVAWALWISVRNQSISRSQAWLMAALCATSTFFLDEFAEMRPYFLAMCAATIVALVWRIVHLRLSGGRLLSRGLLVAWAAPLAAMCSLNYFAMLLGGMFTLALLIEAGLRRRYLDAIMLAVLSFTAASPALAMLAVQLPHLPHTFWITTTPKQALELYVQFARAFALNNLMLLALAAVAGLIVLQDRALRLSQRSTLVMLGVLAGFAILLFLMNIAKPMLEPRYLTPASGPLIIAVALLATTAHRLRWASTAILLAALLATAEAVATDKHARDGWDVSAKRVADLAAACPTSTVYAATWLGESNPNSLAHLEHIARKVGHEHYQRQYGFRMIELDPGDKIPTDRQCPSYVWAEHTFVDQIRHLDAQGVLELHQLQPTPGVKLEFVSSGAIITIPASAD